METDAARRCRRRNRAAQATGRGSVSNSDLARKLKLDRSYVARVVRLASLAPQIIEAILDDREPEGLPRRNRAKAGLSLNTLRQDLPLAWQEQGRVLTATRTEPRPPSLAHHASD